MDHFFVCGVCAEPYSSSRIPLVLQCGHTFCSFCLSVIKETRRTLNCPIDRLIESRPIEEIKRNISLSELIDYHSQELLEKCQVHQMKTAKFLCFECRTAFCTRCVQTHVFHRWTQLASPEQIFNYLSTRKESLIQIKAKIHKKFENFRTLEEDILKNQQLMIEEAKNSFQKRESELRVEKEIVIQKIFQECSENLLNFQRVRIIINDLSEKIEELLKVETDYMQNVLNFEDECSRIENALRLVESV